jgi:NADH:ubiquinone oxidoreductase subunit H
MVYSMSMKLIKHVVCLLLALGCLLLVDAGLFLILLERRVLRSIYIREGTNKVGFAGDLKDFRDKINCLLGTTFLVLFFHPVSRWFV